MDHVQQKVNIFRQKPRFDVLVVTAAGGAKIFEVRFGPRVTICSFNSSHDCRCRLVSQRMCVAGMPGFFVCSIVLMTFLMFNEAKSLP